MTPFDIIFYGFSIGLAAFFIIVGIAAGFSVVAVLVNKFDKK